MKEIEIKGGTGGRRKKSKTHHEVGDNVDVAEVFRVWRNGHDIVDLDDVLVPYEMLKVPGRGREQKGLVQ
jgi:hypothetical protein